MKQFIKTTSSKAPLAFKISLLIILFGSFSVSAQDTLDIDKEIRNAKKHSSIYRYGNYIPFDILDAIRVVGVTYDSTTIQKFKNRSLTEVYYYGIDSTTTGIRRDWSLEGQSHLALYFNELGLYYHKSMKLMISKCYHDHLNDRTLNVKKNIRWVKSKYRKEERLARKRVTAINKTIKKDRKKIYKYEDKEKENAYDQHNTFYKQRDKNLKKLEKKRIKKLKKGEGEGSNQ